MYSIRASLEPLLRFGRTVERLSDKAAADTAMATLRRLRKGTYWKNRTGALSKSFAREKKGTAFYVVASSSPVAAFLDKGTRAHTIEPKNAKALRFRANGSIRFAKRVHHPGTKAVYFEAMEQVVGSAALAAAAEAAVQRAASGA